MEGRPVLLYDGDCGFCRHWVEWCQERGADVEFQPCQDATALRDAMGVPDHWCQETAIYIDEHGAMTHEDAINAVLRRIPKRRWRAMAALGRVPGLHALEAIGYRLVAKNRHRFRGPKRQDEDAPRDP